MTIKEIVIKLDRFGEGKESLNIPISLDNLITAIKSAPDGTDKTKYLWLYIHGFIDGYGLK